MVLPGAQQALTILPPAEAGVNWNGGFGLAERHAALVVCAHAAGVVQRQPQIPRVAGQTGRLARLRAGCGCHALVGLGISSSSALRTSA